MDTGTRLKLVRERNNLSQRELARRSGLTNSTISQIEQNRVSPSVSSLKKLLEGIPMSLAEFFSFDEPVREERFVFRGAEQPDLGRNGLRMLLVGASVEGRQMRMLRELYAPGADSGEPIVHAEGEECGLVTRGTVELWSMAKSACSTRATATTSPLPCRTASKTSARTRPRLSAQTRRRISDLDAQRFAEHPGHLPEPA